MEVGRTVAATATATSVAPVLDKVMLEEILPAGAAAAMRAKNVPPIDGRLATGPKLALSEETCMPAGAVMVMAAVRLVEVTARLCEAEAVPVNVEKAAKDPDGEITGKPAFGVTDAQSVPTRMLPRRRVGAFPALPWRKTTESMFAWSFPAELVTFGKGSLPPRTGLTHRLATSSVVVVVNREIFVATKYVVPNESTFVS